VGATPAVRVGRDREEYRRFLQRLPSGSQIALEASGHCYWMVDEMEDAGHRLVHPLEAKKRMGKTANVTPQRNVARGMDSSRELRDQRELLRLRMFLMQQRTRLKNRISRCAHPLQHPDRDAGCVWRARKTAPGLAPDGPARAHARKCGNRVKIQMEETEKRLDESSNCRLIGFARHV
jgi:hypothetical protein